MNVDRRLAEAQLAEVVNHDSGNDPVFVVRRHFHPAKGGVLTENLIHRLLQQEYIRRIADERSDQRGADEHQLLISEVRDRDGHALHLQLASQSRCQRHALARSLRRLNGDGVVQNRKQQPGGDREQPYRAKYEKRCQPEKIGDPARVVDARTNPPRAFAVIILVDDLAAMFAADRVRGDFALTELAEGGLVGRTPPLRREVFRAPFRSGGAEQQEAAGGAHRCARLVGSMALGAAHGARCLCKRTAMWPKCFYRPKRRSMLNPNCRSPLRRGDPW